MKNQHLTRLFLGLAIPALAGFACSGGSAGVGPTGGGGNSGGAGSGAGGTTGAVTVDCTMDPGSTTNDISDFEDGSGTVLPNGNRNGGWYTYIDTTATCLVMPAPHATATAAEIPGGRCASMFAIHFTGTGCTTWGAGVGTDLNAVPAAADAGAGPATGPKQVYDVSGYTGITFWSRADHGASMRLKVPMSDETKVADGGLCVEMATAKCSDNFGSNIALTSKWIKHTVMFSTMAQEKWGKPFTWNPAHVTSIQFQVPAAALFDVWIDDVAFIK
jgi:hypothetical protein